MPPEICPNCGAVVPPRAKACPECGSDETTGWSEQAHADGLDLPEQDFKYDEFVKREFGKQGPVPHGLNPVWWVVGIGAILAFLLLLFRL